MHDPKLLEEEIVQPYDQEPSEEEVVEAVYAFAVEHMQNGASGQEVKALLVENGLDPESAAIVVSTAPRFHSGCDKDIHR